MDLGETGINILLGTLIALLLVANFFFRKRKSEKTPLGMVVGIFSELRHNQKLTETFSFHHTIQRFRTSHWNKSKNRIDLVPIEIRVKLEKAFDLTEDANNRINAAKKSGSDSYMAGIDVGRMKEPIAVAEHQLREWLQENMDNPELQPKKRGMVGGGLFGGK